MLFRSLDNANISLKVSGGTQVRELGMKFLGNGRYYSSIEGLPEGDYYFTGDVLHNGRKLGSDNGRFNIGDIPLEYKDLRMNINLLRKIAERSGGKFYFPEEVDKVIDDIKSHRNFQSTAITRRFEHILWNLPYLLAFTILCFGLEWFFRKRYGMI